MLGSEIIDHQVTMESSGLVLSFWNRKIWIEWVLSHGQGSA